MSADPGQGQPVIPDGRSTPNQGSSGGQDAVEGTPGEKDANAPDPGTFEPAKGEDGAPMSPDQLRDLHWVDEDNVFHAGMPGPDALAKGGTVDSEGTYHVERDASGNTIPPADGGQDQAQQPESPEGGGMDIGGGMDSGGGMDDHGSGGGTSSFYGNGDQGGDDDATSGFHGNGGGGSGGDSGDSSGDRGQSSFHGSGSGGGDNGESGGKYFDENDSNRSYGHAMFDSEGDDQKGHDNGGDDHKGYENKGYEDDKDDKGGHDSHHDDSQHASHH